MPEEMKPQYGFLLLADISGYTAFLAKSELDHAHGIISDLMDLITGHLKPMFSIVKLEGDAVFAYASADSVQRKEHILEAIEATYVAFRNRIQAVHRRTTCGCKACGSIPTLDLKFVLHAGSYVKRLMAGTSDLVGTDVTIVHRLLKNSISGATGWHAYVLLSNTAREEIALPATHLHHSIEEYEHLEPVETFSFDLQERFNEIVSERRILAKVADPDLTFDILVHAPAPVVWEWLNDPDKRGITDEATITVQTRVNGRIREGATFHCAHGKSVAMEEVVEWKPFSSFAFEHHESFATLLFVFDLIPEGENVRVSVRLKLNPRARFLQPFSKPIARLLAKIIRMQRQFDRFRQYAEEDWSRRLSVPSIPS